MNLSENNIANSADIMVAGLGHAGTQALLCAAGQFDNPFYKLLVADISNELINIESDKPLHGLTIEDGWEQKLPEVLHALKMLVIIVGLGGKTGAAAAKTFIEAAEKENVPTIVFATLPFDFEGDMHKKAATKSLQDLKSTANAVVVIPNELLFSQLDPNTKAQVAFEESNAWLAEAAVSIVKPFTNDNLINVKMENLAWLTNKKHSTCGIGIGWGEGENAIVEAMQQLSDNPLLKQYVYQSSADAALVMVSFPEDATKTLMHEYLMTISHGFQSKINLEICACLDSSVAEGVRIVALMRFPTKPTATTPSAVEEQPKPASRNKRKINDAQLELGLVTYTKTGIFGTTSPTRYGFLDLDVPTYLRKKQEP